jgi:hypothetical protein
MMFMSLFFLPFFIISPKKFVAMFSLGSFFYTIALAYVKGP